MNAPRSKTLLFFPAAAAMMGCSANVAGSVEVADAEASPVTAVIVVERSTRFDDRAGGVGGLGDALAVRGEAVARFVRMRSGVVDDDALRMVGAAVDIPAPGACVRISQTAFAGQVGGASDRPDSIARAVELVDVGAVSLEADGAKTTFNARRLPDVVDLVSGVVYTGRGEDTFPAHGRFVFHAGGPSITAAELDIAPFAIEAIVAGEPADLRLNQEPVPTSSASPVMGGMGGVGGAGGAAGASSATIAGGAPVELTWTSGGDASDLVYVDIGDGTARAGRAGLTRCAFTDGGHGVLPASAIGDEGTLSVHRVHREAFRARGIDSGEIRFDFARVVSFRRR